jgi:flagellar basal-body rod protein FlgC
MSDGPFASLDVSASALAAERLRMNVIATNIANAGTLKTPEGGPYKRREVVFENVLRASSGTQDAMSQPVRARIQVDNSPGDKRHDPTHPLANAEGDVLMPNVSATTEMVDLMTAARSYEANLSAIKIYREMIQKTITLGR